MKFFSTRLLNTLLYPILFILPQLLQSQIDIISFEEGLKNPPESAKPGTWWHWTNNNITKEGITKDLEWMKRAGIRCLLISRCCTGIQNNVSEI